MNTEPRASNGRSGFARVALILVGAIGLVLMLCFVGITGFFRLSSETAALRDSFLNEMPGAWNKKIALRVGAVTTWLARTGLKFVDMDPDARQAVGAVRSGEVGIYDLSEEPTSRKLGEIIARADRAMQRRGWSRVVGVSHERELVAVYFPTRVSVRRAKCCVMVFEGRQLIVGSAGGNLEPILAVASKHLEHHLGGELFAKR